ncbi:MAG: hypothetical protein IKD06_03390 [Clostridia bacterium]|nr:hypothetical protein [Clostridia bacterium]
MDPKFLIAAVFIGFIAGMIAMYTVKRTAGRIVRILLDNEAESPETGCEFSCFGIEEKSFTSRLLKGKTLSSLIFCEEGRWFIPPQNREKVLAVYGRSSMSVGMFVLCVVIFAIVGVISCFAFPALFERLY